jgi:glycerate kinase
MRILIAPDSYKGSLSALEAARTMKKGMLEVFPKAKIVLASIADGGAGMNLTGT